jgi:hypothetical protein
VLHDSLSLAKRGPFTWTGGSYIGVQGLSFSTFIIRHIGKLICNVPSKYRHQLQIYYIIPWLALQKTIKQYRQKSQDSSASTVTGLWVGELGFNSRQSQEIFIYSTASRPALGAQPASSIQRVLGPLLLGVKWPGCEADHSSPSGAKVKNGGAILLLSHTSHLHDIGLN